MNCKNLIALGLTLFIAACATSTEPTEGTDPVPATSDPAEAKSENTASTSEAIVVGSTCGTTTCGFGTHCCACSKTPFCASHCPATPCY